MVMELADLALFVRPDLLVLPETFPSCGVSHRQVTEVAEAIDGHTVTVAAERARRGRCYVICPLFLRRGNDVFNSAVVLGRDGSLVGTYDKLQPVTSTPDYTIMESGVTPGAAPRTFDLDFGRIGVQICFDLCFPDAWAELARQGARLVVWPSAYNGGFPLRALAALHHYYVISAVGTERAKIIDPCGTVLAETQGLTNVVWRDVNLDFAVCHTDFNYAIPDRILATYGDRVEVRMHQDEGYFLVEPRDPAITTDHLRQTLGFIDRADYFARHRAAYACLQHHGTAAPQVPPHGARSQYSKR
jgi:predicted amidohydrolase